MNNKTHFWFMGAAGLFFIFVLAVSWLINRVFWADTGRPLLEGVCFSALALYVLSRKPFKNYLAGLPRAHLIVLAVLFFPLCVGQYIERPKATYPFVAWRMFAYPEPERYVTFYELKGVYPDGTSAVINPAYVFPTLAHGRIALGIDNLMQEIERERREQKTKIIFSKAGATDKSRSGPRHFSANLIRHVFKQPEALGFTEKQKLVFELLRAVGRQYNRRHPQRPLTAIHLMRATATARTAPVREKVWEVRIERENAL